MTWVDLHLHGAFGVDVAVAGPRELDHLALGLAERGYSAFLPTLVPLAPDALAAAVDRLGAWIAGRKEGDGRGAVPLGVHFEGPFVSPHRAGALHPSRFLDGSSDAAVSRFLALVESAPGRPMVTLAPEIAGGLELIRALDGRGALVSIGHTDATFDQMDAACAAGARHMTHFCNAMRPLHHREPGPIGYGLLRTTLTIDVIADLHHVHPRMIELLLRDAGPQRVALISDAIPAAGSGDGDWLVWGETLRVAHGVARNAAGALAGSTCLLDVAVRNVAALGVDAERARAMASAVPRRILMRDATR